MDEDLIKDERPVSLIKIDVEGMEFDVIRGAKRIIKKWMPVICIEYNSPPWNLADLIQEIPYPVKILRIPNTLHESMREIKPTESLPGVNNLIIQSIKN